MVDFDTSTMTRRQVKTQDAFWETLSNLDGPSARQMGEFDGDGVPRTAGGQVYEPLSRDSFDFWGSRQLLSWIRDYARSSRVSPWALLGCILSRISVSVSPRVVTEPLCDDGLPGTLNLFVAVVGEPGAGKNRAMSMAKNLIPNIQKATVTSPASGEAIAAFFAARSHETDEDGGNDMECLSPRALLTFSEVGTLEALAKRNGSTIVESLKKAFSGDDLGESTKSEDRRLMVPEYGYRLALQIGVQPAKSGVLFDDVYGGLPQRFLFVPTTDGMAPDERPQRPEGKLPIHLDRLPDGYLNVDKEAINTLYAAGSRANMLNGGDAHYPLLKVTMPDAASKEADENYLKSLRHARSADPLDVRATELKVRLSALLALADGRTSADDSDWTCASEIVRQSAETREYCMEQARAGRQEKRAEQFVDDDRASEISEEKLLARAREAVLRVLTAKNRPLTGRDIRSGLSGPQRKVVDLALSYLETDGDIRQISETNDSGRTSVKWILA